MNAEAQQQNQTHPEGLRRQEANMQLASITDQNHNAQAPSLHLAPHQYQDGQTINQPPQPKILSSGQSQHPSNDEKGTVHTHKDSGEPHSQTDEPGPYTLSNVQEHDQSANHQTNAQNQQQDFDRLLWLCVYTDQFTTWK